MEIKFKRIPYSASAINVHEDKSLIMGFTETGFKIEDLEKMYPGNQLVQLKQIHSNIILPAARITGEKEGDGIILREKGIIAVIKTADCVPLFFWDHTPSIAGILHIGWKGLMYGIEQELLKTFTQEAFPIEWFHFATGPAIESGCYEVGAELYEKFALKSYRDEIFSPKKNGKFWLDIKHGITCSLRKFGISERQISHSPLCTYCLYPRFPSYRKNGKTGQRIFNFIILK